MEENYSVNFYFNTYSLSVINTTIKINLGKKEILFQIMLPGHKSEQEFKQELKQSHGEILLTGSLTLR